MVLKDHHKKRHRKKLRLGEYVEFGFSVSAQVQHTSVSDRFIDEAIEENGLLFGGLIEPEIDGFVTLASRGTVTDVHRSRIEKWLLNQENVSFVKVGALVDAWN